MSEVFEYANGDKEWWVNGVRHREDGPAIERANGDKVWYLNGVRHREDGPAAEYANGEKKWYINGELIDSYYPNFGCNELKIKTREEALARLNSKPRPYSYDLYMADINQQFPE